jgi:hypothetical protein
MAKPADVFKKRKYVCVGSPTHKFTELRWESAGLPLCPTCGGETELDYGSLGESAAVIGDEIDIAVKHGLCNDDGTPRRFRSMSELRRAAAEKGLVIHGETPKPLSYIAEREAAWQENVNRRWR